MLQKPLAAAAAARSPTSRPSADGIQQPHPNHHHHPAHTYPNPYPNLYSQGSMRTHEKKNTLVLNATNTLPFSPPSACPCAYTFTCTCTCFHLGSGCQSNPNKQAIQQNYTPAKINTHIDTDTYMTLPLLLTAALLLQIRG